MSSISQDIAVMEMQGMVLATLGLADKSKGLTGALEKVVLDIAVALNPQTSLEIGAHSAAFSRKIKRRLPQSSTYAYEANPEVYKNFVERLNRQGVKYENLAISDEPGIVKIRVPLRDGRQLQTMSSILAEANLTEFIEFDVSAIRVDDLGVQDPIMWIDVEGAVGNVLRGATETLKSTKMIYVELEEVERWPGQMLRNNVIEFLAERGFTAFLRDIQRPWQCNVLFVRREYIDARMLRLREEFFSRLPALGTQACEPVED